MLRRPRVRAWIEVVIGVVFTVGFVVDVARGLTARQLLIGLPFFLVAVAVLVHGVRSLRPPS